MVWGSGEEGNAAVVVEIKVGVGVIRAPVVFAGAGGDGEECAG